MQPIVGATSAKSKSFWGGNTGEICSSQTIQFIPLPCWHSTWWPGPSSSAHHELLEPSKVHFSMTMPSKSSETWPLFWFCVFPLLSFIFLLIRIVFLSQEPSDYENSNLICAYSRISSLISTFHSLSSLISSFSFFPLVPRTWLPKCQLPWAGSETNSVINYHRMWGDNHRTPLGCYKEVFHEQGDDPDIETVAQCLVARSPSNRRGEGEGGGKTQ